VLWSHFTIWTMEFYKPWTCPVLKDSILRSSIINNNWHIYILFSLIASFTYIQTSYDKITCETEFWRAGYFHFLEFILNLFHAKTIEPNLNVIFTQFGIMILILINLNKFYVQ
jgi:hypothetical protein